MHSKARSGDSQQGTQLHAKAKEKHRYEQELKIQLELLEQNLGEENYPEYVTIKKQLEQINHEYAMGVQLCSKAKFIDKTEQNLSFFTKEETRNYNMHYIGRFHNQQEKT